MNHTTGYINDLWKFDGTYWTWVSGNDSVDTPGNYGTKGVSSPNNYPSARATVAGWLGPNDTLWLFGGYEYPSGKFPHQNTAEISSLHSFSLDSNPNLQSYTGSYNDVWKFDGQYWTWISGSSTANVPGVYGTMGVSSSTTISGSRNNHVACYDPSTEIVWIFGGYGFDTNFNDGQ